MRETRVNPLLEVEKLKYEIAEELGLLNKLIDVGFSGLTSIENGRIGGVLAARLRQMKRE